MTTRYLLDSDVLSDLVRHSQGRIAERPAYRDGLRAGKRP